MPEPVFDETNAHKLSALSPKLFCKTTFATEVLQQEIKIPQLNMRRPSMRFDPAYNRKLPVNMDIPDLYTIKNRPATPKDPMTRSGYVAKMQGKGEGLIHLCFKIRKCKELSYMAQIKQ